MLNEEDKIIRLGEYLRYQRERRGISIEQVASATKINLKVLRDLECDNFETLPAKIFVRGFASNYCKYIGIDSDEVLSRFDTYLDEKTARKHRRSEDAPHIFVDKESSGDSSKTMLKVTMITFMVLGAIAIAVIKPSMKGKKRHKDKAITNEEIVTVLPPTLLNLPPQQPTEIVAGVKPAEVKPVEIKPIEVVPAETKPVEQKAIEQKPIEPIDVKPKVAEVKAPDIKPVEVKPAEVKPVEIKTVEVKPPETKPTDPKSAADAKAELAKKEFIPHPEVKYLLVVQATEDSWVKYQADDFKLRNFTLRTGQKVFVKARKAIRFITGNPKGIQISTNYKDFKEYDQGTKLFVIPSTAEAEYTATPFIAPNGKPSPLLQR